MFDSAARDRWRPGWPLVVVLVSLGLMLVALTDTMAALRGPRWLGYETVAAARAHLWRVTTVWPSSFAWEVGLRPGTLLRGAAPPATNGAATVDAYIKGGWRSVTMPLRPAAADALAPFALALAVTIFAIGALTLLFARARRPALILLLFCLAIALGACGVVAFGRGAPWGGALFETCFLALLPPLTLLLATVLPPGGRTLRLGLVPPAALGGALCALLAAGYRDVALYVPTRRVVAPVFLACQALAIGLWMWRAWPERRGGPRRPEYRLVLLGLGGSGGGVALLSFLPALLAWYPPWPREAGALAVLLLPTNLSYALLRHRLLEVRRSLQRAVITAALLAGVLLVGFLLTAEGRFDALDVVIVVLLAGLGVPLAQRALDRLLPDSHASYATLLQVSGERLGLAVEAADVDGVLEDARRGMGLSGLRLCRGKRVLALAGAVDPARTPHRLLVRHDADDLATLEVGEKLRHDALFAADLQALAILCQQLGAFLARQRLVLRLSETVTRLEESQERLLTARRLERERLGQDLHRGPLQDVLLLEKMLPPHGAPAVAAAALATRLRAILTETASATLHDLGLPAALRAFMAYLAPHASAQGCALHADVDDAAVSLASDESFTLYQLAHEALINVVRHSGARRVEVSLRAEDRTVTLMVRDDGQGLPSGWDQARVDHRGLRDALELVRTVKGAEAAADSTLAGGTVVRASVPWRARTPAHLIGLAAGDTDVVRVLIAEDHSGVRQGLRRVLEEDPRLVVVAAASTGHEILSLALRYQPDVLLLDLDLPGQSGLDALRALRAHAPRPPRTLVLSAFDDGEYARQARDLGAVGFLDKDCDGDELRRAVHGAVAGG